MTILHHHRVVGCSPTPLAHYLKAVGLLRVLSAQADGAVRGWWEGEHFCLLTHLSAEQLEQFFLSDYAPTPFVSPWNKGSGFYQAADPGLVALAGSSAARFAAFRLAIAEARAPLRALGEADAAVRAVKAKGKTRPGASREEKAQAKEFKESEAYKRELADAEREFKRRKDDLFGPLCKTWRGPHRDWLDAAVVILDGGNKKYPSLLGTGGSDGRLDFTNNAMRRIIELFDLTQQAAPAMPQAGELLREALWKLPSTALLDSPIGQFLPGSAGGANSTTGPDGTSLINPWDFLLMLEGTVAFRARTSRRLDPNASAKASAPFAVRSHAAGYATPGDEKADRHEQWMPLWPRPCTFAELEALLGEARLQLGRQVANRPIDVARAIGRLGVARGIESFVRFGYLERNGQSNFAIPLGRIRVRALPQARLIDDLAGWLDRLNRGARDKHAPQRLKHAERRLANAVLEALSHDHTPQRWQDVLAAAAAVEGLQAAGTAIEAGPIPALSPEWLSAIDDGSAEVRLAAALASAAGAYALGGQQPKDPIRHHWLPLERGGRRFEVRDKKLANSPRVVAGGRDFIDDAVAVVERRLVEASGASRRELPLVAAPGCGAHLQDLEAALSGGVDFAKVHELARALMALHWQRVRPKQMLRGPERSKTTPPSAWLALRLAFLPWPLVDGRRVPVDPAAFRRLAAGDLGGAFAVARDRLRGAGVIPPMREVVAAGQFARVWAACMVFPISHHTALQILNTLESRKAA